MLERKLVPLGKSVGNVLEGPGLLDSGLLLLGRFLDYS